MPSSDKRFHNIIVSTRTGIPSQQTLLTKIKIFQTISWHMVLLFLISKLSPNYTVWWVISVFIHSFIHSSKGFMLPSVPGIVLGILPSILAITLNKILLQSLKIFKVQWGDKKWQFWHKLINVIFFQTL